MALTATTIYNSVKWKEDVASRKKAFASVTKYKKMMEGVRKQVNGIGDIKLKVTGMQQATSKINSLKKKLDKVSSTKKTNTGSNNANSDFMGPKKPPIQGSYKKEVDAAARLAEIEKFELTPNMQKLSKAKRESYLTSLKEIKSMKALKQELVRRKALVRETVNLEREHLRTLNKQSFAHQRSTASLKQMAGAAFSVYTGMAAIGAIAKTGMDMQNIEASMLSVSKNAKESKEQMAFLRKESHRLGMDRVKAGRAYSKILAARGELSLEESQKLFSGVSEAGVVSGTSADEMSLQVKALSQMLG